MPEKKLPPRCSRFYQVRDASFTDTSLSESAASWSDSINSEREANIRYLKLSTQVMDVPSWRERLEQMKRDAIAL